MLRFTPLRAAALATALCTTSVHTGAAAADLMKPGGYPERAVTIIVPYGASGGSSQVARAWSKAMQEVTGVAYNVENKPGGGGLAAMPDYVSRPHDGYTILEQTDSLISAGAANQVNFKVTEDVIPICFTQATFSQLYIRPNESRFTDFDSMVAYAKANPGQLTIANIGVEKSMEVLLMGWIAEAVGIKVKEISYDKPAERYAALLGSHADVLFEQPGDVRKFLDAGRMKPVLTILDKAPSLFADVPALGDVGIEIPLLQRVRGFWMHKNVPQERRDYVRKACKKAFETKSYQAFNKSKYMHLARSYYDGEDAIKLARDMMEAYAKTSR